MPGKKKKGGAGKKGKKGKGKKAAAAAAQKEEMARACRLFLKLYQQRCLASDSAASVNVVRECRACLESEKPLVKFILEPSQGAKPPTSTAAMAKPSAAAPKGAKRAAAPDTITPGSPKLPADRLSPASPGPLPPPPPNSLSAESAPVAQEVTARSSSSRAPRGPPVLLQPLVESWTELKYSYMRCLHVWSIELPDEGIVALALFMESPLGTNMKVMELMETKLSPWAINRLARSLSNSQLTVLTLDYQNIPVSSLATLCGCLQHCVTLQSLNLNYCNLNASSGECIGALAAVSNIKEFSLRGNQLECEGAVELLRPVVALCESEEQHRPALAKLYLQDNAIDSHGSGGEFEPIVCMRVFRRLILKSEVLEELNLDGNLIGEGGGRELMQAMQERKEGGHPAIRLTVTHKMSSETFSQIIELSSARGKKKGKKGKKGKKKK